MSAITPPLPPSGPIPTPVTASGGVVVVNDPQSLLPRLTPGSVIELTTSGRQAASPRAVVTLASPDGALQVRLPVAIPPGATLQLKVGDGTETAPLRLLAVNGQAISPAAQPVAQPTTATVDTPSMAQSSPAVSTMELADMTPTTASATAARGFTATVISPQTGPAGGTAAVVPMPAGTTLTVRIIDIHPPTTPSVGPGTDSSAIYASSAGTDIPAAIPVSLTTARLAQQAYGQATPLPAMVTQAQAAAPTPQPAPVSDDGLTADPATHQTDPSPPRPLLTAEETPTAPAPPLAGPATPPISPMATSLPQASPAALATPPTASPPSPGPASEPNASTVHPAPPPPSTSPPAMATGSPTQPATAAAPTAPTQAATPTQSAPSVANPPAPAAATATQAATSAPSAALSDPFETAATAEEESPTPSSASTGFAPQTLSGVVAPNSHAGQPLIQTTVGLLALATPTELPAGATVTLETLDAPLAPSADAVLGAALDDTTFPGPSFLALVEIMRQAGVPGMSAETAAPDLPARLTAALLGLGSSVDSGTVKPWLGQKWLKKLAKDGHQGLIERMDKELRALKTDVRMPGGGEWQCLTLPLPIDHRIDPVRLVVRRSPGDEKSKKAGEDEGTRFLVDITMTKLGALQIDGLLWRKTKRFDLILRSHSALPDDVRKGVDEIFRRSLDGMNMVGSTSFQQTRVFVEPFPATAPKPSGWVI